ncbi:MAG: Hpt domain-containing protein [Pseudomonadota bacterium]
MRGSPPADGLVDRAVLSEFAEAGGVDLLDALAAAAAAEAETHFEALTACCGSGDRAAAEHALHTLKGTGASLGLAPFAAEAERLLDRVRAGGEPGEAELAALAQQWAAGFAAFEALRATFVDPAA